MVTISLRFVFFLYLLQSSAAAEYKLCATAEHEPLCKWIEASRNEISCVKVSDSVDCLLKMQKKEADFGSFYPEEAFLAARFLGDAGVVLAEVRHPDRANMSFSFETVVVVRKTLFGGLSALKGLSYCHPGFSKAQYWSDRVLKAFENKVLTHFEDDIKSNSVSRSAYEDELYRLSLIFSKACRPGTWAVSDWWDKKLKRDYHTLCDQCEHPTTCSYDVRNKGRHSDALRCLTLHGGNVTYTALEFVQEYFDLTPEEQLFNAEHKNPSRYNFLCPNGSIQPLDSSDPCSWIKQPWTSIIAINSTDPNMLQNLKQWLEVDNNVAWTNHLRTILTRGKGVLNFRHHPLPVADYIKQGRTIPTAEDGSYRKPIKWCVIGQTEKKKCEYLATAALTHGVPTHLQCVGASSKIDCLRKIRSREADVVYTDTDLGYISRKMYNLTASAYLETQRTANYYGVIVIKGSAINKLKDLKGKRACFPQYNGLGWLTYIEALKSMKVIPSHSCSNVKRACNYFSQVCAPGAKDSTMTFDSEKKADLLCKGCFNASEGSSCEAASTNPYYGEIGALRCLDNGDGDVAFLDFHTIQRHLAATRGGSGHSDKWQDLKILCRDGSLETFNSTNPEKCSFTQLNGGEVVTRNDLDLVQKNDIQQTLMELDDLFGTTSRSYNPALRMFEPFDGATNVLFKESAVSLVSIYETQNSFVNNYVKLLTSLENCLEDSGSSILLPSLFTIVFSLVFILIEQ